MALNRHKRVNRNTRLGERDTSTHDRALDTTNITSYSNLIFDAYSSEFNSLGYKSVSVLNTNTSATHDSAQYAFEAEMGLAPRLKGKLFANTSFAPQGQFAYEGYFDKPIDGIFVYQDSTPSHVGKANWVYGDAIRIYTDGTGAGVRFLDSDTFRGGATEAQMVEDSTWSDFGGIIAATTDSAPDNTFRITTWDSSSDWSTHNYLLTTAGDQNYFGNSNYANFKVHQDIVPYEYDSSEILYTQAAFDSASAGGGGGGGPVVAADPESWS